MAETLDTSISNYFNGTCCPDNIISLKTFTGVDTPSYPVGVFNINGDYLGIADNQTEYLTIWNADTNNQIQGVLTAYNNIFTFKLPKTSTIDKVVGLRYWQIELLSGNSELYLSDDNYIELPNGNIVKSETFSFGDPSNVFDYTTMITQTNPVPICTEPFRNIAVPTGLTRVFHNENGNYVSMNVFGDWANNFGNIPPTTKVISFVNFQSDLIALNINPINYLNFFEATKNVENFQINGTQINWDNSFLLHMNKLKSLQYINNGNIVADRYFSNLGLNKTRHPDLKRILIRYNAFGSLGGIGINDFAALPNLVWGFDIFGARVDTSEDLDNIFIGLAQSQILPPSSNITYITALGQQAVNRTNASDTAFTYLENLGFTLN